MSSQRVYFVNDNTVIKVKLSELETNISLIVDNMLYLYNISEEHLVSVYKMRGTL